MREAILSKEFSFSEDGTGTVIESSVFGTQFPFNGIIEQICVRAITGGGANFAMEIRGDSTSSNIEDLYLDVTGQSYDSLITVSRPFDTANTEDNDLSIFFNAAASGTFVMRIDFRILGRIG